MVPPELRASLVKEQLAAIDALPDGSKIRTAVPATTIARIDEASRVDWLPIEVLLDLLEAALTTLGIDQAMSHWRRSTLRSFETPLVKPFTAGVLSLFQPTPAQVMPMVPRLYQMLYRGTGNVSVENAEPNLIYVVHAEMPPVMVRSNAFGKSIAASYEASLAFLRVKEPRVAMAVAPTQARVTYSLRWR
jgi:hypothetical protein